MSDTLPSVVVDHFIARYNAHDVEGLQALVAPGVVWATVVNDSLHVELRGRDALVRYLATSFAKTTGVGSARSASIVVGPFVTFREDAYWQGASGRRTQSALVVYEVRGGLIRSARYF